MGYVVNQRVGVIHRTDCTNLRRIKADNISPWDPAKAQLTPGVIPCPTCLPAGLPEED